MDENPHPRYSQEEVEAIDNLTQMHLAWTKNPPQITVAPEVEKEMEEHLLRLWSKMIEDRRGLWDYATSNLVYALLDKFIPSQAAQDRIWQTFSKFCENLDQGYFHYAHQERGDLNAFLTDIAPSFTLPETRGGSRSDKIARAVQDYTALCDCLKKNLKTRFRNPAARKLRIKDTLNKALGPLLVVPEEKLIRWKSLPPQQIALEVTVWKYNDAVTPSSLKRHRRRKMDELNEAEWSRGSMERRWEDLERFYALAREAVQQLKTTTS